MVAGGWQDATGREYQPTDSHALGALRLLYPGLQRRRAGLDVTRLTADHAAAPLAIQTPDASGQTVEPAVEYVPWGWNGHKWWMLITGYTGGNAVFENPAIYYSDDGNTWTPVPGAPFPLVPYPGGGLNHSDPELTLGPDGLLHGLYMLGADGGPSYVRHQQTADGVSWTDPVTILDITAELGAAPIVVWDAPRRRWLMFYPGAPANVPPNQLFRRVSHGPDLTGPWSAAEVCTVNGLPGGYYLWEGHAVAAEGELHALWTVTNNFGGVPCNLMMGVSTDEGLTWTFGGSGGSVMQTRNDLAWDGDDVYRGDIVPVSSGQGGVMFDLFYSGLLTTAGVHVWGLGRTTIRSV